MNKIFKIFFAIIFVIFVSACSDKKFYDTSINVTFYSGKNASQVESIKDLEPNTKITEPADPTQPGYGFVGWYKEASFVNQWNFDVDTVGDKSFTLFAKWEPVEYTITYVLNGGNPLTGNYPTTYDLNNARLTIFPTSVRQTGYSFVGWYLYDWKDSSGKIQTKPGDFGHNSVPAGTAKDIVVYAHWKAIESVITFNINFPDAVGAPATPKSFTIKYGDVINFVQPVAEGYNFIGWNSKADGSGEFYVNGELFTRTLRTTAYAIWEKKN